MAVTTNINIEEIVNIYIEAWTTPDRDKQRELTEICWAADGILTDNQTHREGREALNEMIDEFKDKKPGATFQLTSVIDHHHNVMRASYRVLDADGNTMLKATDIAEFNAEGKIKRLITFFGPLLNRKRG